MVPTPGCPLQGVVLGKKIGHPLLKSSQTMAGPLLFSGWGEMLSFVSPPLPCKASSWCYPRPVFRGAASSEGGTCVVFGGGHAGSRGLRFPPITGMYMHAHVCRNIRAHKCRCTCTHAHTWAGTCAGVKMQAHMCAHACSQGCVHTPSPVHVHAQGLSHM